MRGQWTSISLISIICSTIFVSAFIILQESADDWKLFEIEKPSVIPRDLELKIIPKITFDKTEYAIDDVAVITLYDASKNTDPNLINKAKIWFTNPRLEIRGLNIDETNIDTGIFKYSINLGNYPANLPYTMYVHTLDKELYAEAKVVAITQPPLLFLPDDMIVNTTDSSGTIVEYSVKAIDDEDGVLEPTCNPMSGSLFPLGNHIVSCDVTDGEYNKVEGSFTITVELSQIVIPPWVKDVAGFWCNDEINDLQFIQAIQYLIDTGVILVPEAEGGMGMTEEVPSWVKQTACWWYEGMLSDEEFTAAIEYLITQGIIVV